MVRIKSRQWVASAVFGLVFGSPAAPPLVRAQEAPPVESQVVAPVETEGEAPAATFTPADPEAVLNGDGSDISAQPISQSVPPVAPPSAAPAAPKPAAKPAAPKPPPAPFKPVFFNNDFSYKKNPNHPYILGEELKDIPIGDYTCWDWVCESKLSFGGELRYRYMDERNRLRPGGPGHSNYDLWRWRNYVDYRFSPQFRAYVEMIDASIFKNELPVTGIDKNRWDLQNYFFDVQFMEWCERPWYARVGRQELLYGNQRLISPLDWANTRRNFEGVKVFTPGEAWDFDAWITNPVNTGTPNNGPVTRFDNEFDSRNQDRLFAGGYWTYKAVKNNTYDLFFLYDQFDSNPDGFPVGERYTTGARWLGNIPINGCDGTPDRTYHMEVEGAYQGGHDRGRDVQAGFVVAGVGHTWNTLPWEPNLWMFYDWASGDRNATDGRNNTFFQGYGLVHAYLGLIDNIARQNIQDLNFRATVKPTKKTQLQAAMHFFYLSNENDSLYQITGAPLGRPTGNNDVGNELDLIAQYNVNQNFSVEAAYFWFWYGDYVDANSPRDDAEMFYLQTTFKY
jgi:hypothetical protein